MTQLPMSKAAGGVAIMDFLAEQGELFIKGLLNQADVLIWVEWTKICKTHACWEQALSMDEGKTWEVNWQMEFFKK